MFYTPSLEHQERLEEKWHCSVAQMEAGLGHGRERKHSGLYNSLSTNMA